MTLFSLHRASIAVAAALAGVCIGAAPAVASITDGTSNTLQVAVAATTIDQAHHRVVIVSPEPAGLLTAGQRIRTVQLVSQRLGYTFENVMAERVPGASPALPRTFPKVESSTQGVFPPGVATSLTEPDGVYPPAT